jgi:hypothetical protein
MIASGSRTRFLSISTLILILGLGMAACSSGGTTGSTTPNGTPGANATQTPPKPSAKPTALPTIDAAFCAKVLSLSEANRYTGFSAANIRVTTNKSGVGGSCNYESSAFKATVFMAFLPNAGSNAIQEAGAQIAQANPQAVVTPVNGLGDSAISVVNPLPGLGTQYHLFLAYGAVMIDVVNPGLYVPTGGDSAALAALTTIARVVISRL